MVAVLDTTIPVFIGRIVTLISSHAPRDAAARGLAAACSAWRAVVLVLRPLARSCCAILVTNQAIAPALTNLIRWQNHWHVVRQSWTFFQNDFAGRIANRVMQTGPALRESVVAAIDAVWYIMVYGTSALVLLASSRLARWRCRSCCGSPAMSCCCAIFVPRLRDRSRDMSEVRSTLTGRIVDSYTNILTVKLFARPRDEDAFVREAIDEHTGTFRAPAAADHALRHARCRC